MTFTTQAATGWSIGQGANGTGRRQKITGYYVVDTRSGQKARAFTGKNAETEATVWAARLDEMLANGYIR